MHPVEHLRFVARARGADPAMLVREAATAFGSLRADPASLVIACRQLLARHPTAAPLWWMAAELLTCDDPAELAWDLADAIDADPTDELLYDALAETFPNGAHVQPITVGVTMVDAADVVLVDALAASPERIVVPVGVCEVVADACQRDIPVWLITSIGVRIAAPYVDAIASVDGFAFDELPLAMVSRVVTDRPMAAGVAPVVALAMDVVFAPELLTVVA